MGKAAARKRRTFTKAFKQEVVRFCRAGDRSVGQVCRDLDLGETAVRKWLLQADVDGSSVPSGELTTAERQELAHLRRELRVVREEREILKKAAAFFAKESR